MLYAQQLARVSLGELVGEWVSELVNRWGLVAVSCCCEKLVAEVGDSSGTQRKGERPPLEAAT
jgi:hypothetical protein